MSKCCCKHLKSVRRSWRCFCKRQSESSAFSVVPPSLLETYQDKKSSTQSPICYKNNRRPELICSVPVSPFASRRWLPILSRRLSKISPRESHESSRLSGAGKKALEERPKPVLSKPTDAIIRITRTTICGTDLHILKGDVPTCAPGRILVARG
jgi:hypothetical protein